MPAINRAGNALKTKREVFLVGGTWTKPAGAKWVKVTCIGGGGGGGSGKRTTVTGATLHAGGGGGAGGQFSAHVFDAADLTSTVAVTVGAGGIGRTPGTSVASSNGGAGADGGESSFGSYLRGTGGNLGFGGTITSGNPGVLVSVGGTDAGGGAGGAGSAGLGSAALPVSTSRAGGGGGGGAGGGAALNAVTGAGGNGGNGVVIVETIF